LWSFLGEPSLNSHKSEKINEQLQDSSNEEQKIHEVNDKIEKRRHQVWKGTHNNKLLKNLM